MPVNDRSFQNLEESMKKRETRISHLLKKKRMRLRLTLRQMAKRTGTSISTLSRWETGLSRPHYKEDRIKAIAEGYELDEKALDGIIFRMWIVPPKRKGPQGAPSQISIAGMEDLLQELACKLRETLSTIDQFRESLANATMKARNLHSVK